MLLYPVSARKPILRPGGGTGPYMVHKTDFIPVGGGYHPAAGVIGGVTPYTKNGWEGGHSISQKNIHRCVHTCGCFHPLNFLLSITASSSQRLLCSFSAWIPTRLTPCGGPQLLKMLGGNEFRLRKFSAALRIYGAYRAAPPLAGPQKATHQLLNFRLSITASSSQRLLYSFSAWPLTQWRLTSW